MPGPLYLEDIAVGEPRLVGEYVLTEEEIVTYARRWDPQPFHLDHDAAARSLFGQLVACAAHLFAIASRLASEDDRPPVIVAGLGGTGMRLAAPGRVGDRLHLRLTYLDARPSRSRPGAGVVHQRLELLDQDDRLVMAQEGAILVARRPEATGPPTAAGPADPAARAVPTEHRAPPVTPGPAGRAAAGAAGPAGRPSDHPVALITGANKGIGLAIARGLAERGLTVLVGARDPVRGAAAVAELRADGLDAHLTVIDITDGASVAAAAAALSAGDGRLDVLVNNAAVKLEFHPAPPTQTALEVVRETYETNVFGTIRVIQALLPLLLASPAPRIVNLSSRLGSSALATTPGGPIQARPLLGYNTAKAALNSLTIQFANQLAGTPVKINAADPGYVRTDMTRNDGSRTPAQGAVVAIRLATLPDDGPSGGFFDERGPIPW